MTLRDFISKMKDFSERLSEENLQNGAGTHSLIDCKKSKQFYITEYMQTANIFTNYKNDDLEDVGQMMFLCDENSYNILSNVPNHLGYSKIIKN